MGETGAIGHPDAAIQPPAAMHTCFNTRPSPVILSVKVRTIRARLALVVTESPGALHQGSALNFVSIDGQIRFELSLDAAEKRGLKLSSRLVAVSNNQQARSR